MKKMEILNLAVDLIMNSTDVIIQRTIGKDVYVFKLHKLKCPTVRISTALNGEVKNNREMDLEEGFPILCDAIELAYIK
jgi:hypothetical protein